MFPFGPNHSPQTLAARGKPREHVASAPGPQLSAVFLTWRAPHFGTGRDPYERMDAPGQFSSDGSIKRLYVNGAQVIRREVGRALVYDVAPVPVTIGAVWSIGMA